MYRSCNIRGARLSSILRLTLESRKYEGNDYFFAITYMKMSKCVIEIKGITLRCYRRIVLIIMYILFV